ncbi:uncharacterized protein LOC114759187 [Neltuma alba]|uniref:uncharacterized protein LOC114759187 n=1 Tax=Neltuma alba TaxID=207710 RepID=UPI0010A51844|nr:uncharacterized protein LOC114759187 [Prosopis alba]
MERNNQSYNSSRCTKIREALANSSAVRAIHRISHYHHQEPSGSPLPQPRHIRGDYNDEVNGAVPIKFVDHPDPTFNGQAQVGKVAGRIEPERPHYASVNRAAARKGEQKGKSAAQELEHQHEKKDMNYIFGEYIQRAREKLRTVSNIGKGHHSKPAQDEASVNVAKKKDTHKDQISEFIIRTKKKIRTTSSIRFGKNESLRRG